MYHRVRQKMRLVVCAILILVPIAPALPTIDNAPDPKLTTEPIDNFENNIIDFDDEYSVKYSDKYDVVPWKSEKDKYVKDSHRYTIIKDDIKSKTNGPDNKDTVTVKTIKKSVHDLSKFDTTMKPNLDITLESTTETDYSVIPLELISTTENVLLSIIESTTDQDLSVIPLSTTTKAVPIIEIKQPVILPTSTQEPETATYIPKELIETSTSSSNVTTIEVQTTTRSVTYTKIDLDDYKDKAIHVEQKTFATTDPDKANLEPTVNKNVTNEELVKIIKTPEISNTVTQTSNTVREVSTKTTGYDDSDQNTSTNKNTNNTEEVNKIAKTNILSVNETIETNISKKVGNESKNGDNITKTESDYKKNETILYEDVNKTSQNKTVNTSNANVTISSNLNETIAHNSTLSVNNSTIIQEILTANSSIRDENVTHLSIDSKEVDEKDVPVFTELDAEDEEVPEDYYDAKDVVPTTAPSPSALSVLVGLAGSVVESVVESVAERVVPKGIFDLFKRMQRQSEALEAERLRSREENGGLGQFGRGILKTISTGLSKPLSQLMAGAKDIGSLDTDRGFVGSLASGVTSVATVATSLADAFKDRVQAIYPGTVWCGDGHSATARSGELGLFFFTDTCCRQHDACKIYIRAGDTKYGLTNTGLFTRSHCSCDAKFRECLRRTNSLVSAQIGLTYFNVLGPQCFRRAHPIVKCIKRTRITGQKCEEYEFDYSKPKMWQWFDNETF